MNQAGDHEGALRRVLADGHEDRLVREEPLRLLVHGEPLLTMRTPGHDQDLALGFLLAEGVVQRPAEVLAMRATPGDVSKLEPDTLTIDLATSALPRVRQRLARTHEIRASCGACGLVDAEHLLEGMPPLLPGVPRFDLRMVTRLMAGLDREQRLFQATGGSHAAALFAADGRLLAHAEDVGRHNALDKAIGSAARAGPELSHAIALLSGRAGFDLVLKCLRVRIPIILSVSAPSALGFDLCRTAGATLIGFVRGDRATVYVAGGRLDSGTV